MTESNWHVKQSRCTTLFLLIATLVAIGVLPCRADDLILVESRKADGTPNAPVWMETSGKWNTSKNKSRVADSSLVASSVSICTTNVPVPAFRIAPTGLSMDMTYKVEVTFGTSSTHPAASDLMVAVATEGISQCTIPTNTPSFQVSGANSWIVLGTIMPVTDHPSLRFTYLSGSLSKESRWYADAIRFIPEEVTK